jgi:integrase
MPTIELTERAARGLTCPPNKNEVTYWSTDLAGFGLRCRASGVHTWVVWYRAKSGETRKHTLGDPKHVKFAKAREEAKRLLAAAKLGRDPAGEVNAARAEAKAAMTIGEAVEKYLDRQEQHLKPRSYAEIVRHLRVDAKPLHRHRVDKVTQRMVADLLEDIARRAPVAANRVRASLSALFAWSMKRAVATANPVALTGKPSAERSRDRVLSDGELALVWRCAGADSDFGRIVRLLILTGARCQEIAGMRWSELVMRDNGTATWVLPAGRSKNGRAHQLALPAMAVGLLPPRRQTAEGQPRELLFGGGEGPFAGWSNCKTRLDQRIAKANGDKLIPAWRLHDIRRSVATKMNDLGVEPHVVEAVLNHVSGARASVAGIYNRSLYTDQKRAALIRWCSHIAQLTGGGDDRGGAEIVPLRRAG